MFEITVEYTNSFYLKTNPKVYEDSMKEALEYFGEIFLQELKNEAPVRTGRLRDGHYLNFNGLKGNIGNNVDYAKYVIYGTRYQAPNNYPSRVISRMNFGEYTTSMFTKSLITRGVL